MKHSIFPSPRSLGPYKYEHYVQRVLNTYYNSSNNQPTIIAMRKLYAMYEFVYYISKKDIRLNDTDIRDSWAIRFNRYLYIYERELISIGYKYEEIIKYL